MLSLVCCVSIHAIKIDKDVVTSDGMRRVSASAFNIYQNSAQPLLLTYLQWRLI